MSMSQTEVALKREIEAGFRVIEQYGYTDNRVISIDLAIVRTAEVCVIRNGGHPEDRRQGWDLMEIARWARASGARGSSGLACRQHLPTQDGIDARLVTLALGLEPVQHIGIDAGRDLLLDGAIEPPTHGSIPLRCCQHRTIAGVDRAVRPGG